MNGENAPAKSPADQQPESPMPKPPTLADLLLEVIRLRYPHERLTGEVLAHIHGEIRADLFGAALLRGYPLRNSDAPAFRFAAFRAD